MLDSEAIGLPPDVHFAALALKALAASGAFNVSPEPD
jgi:hypothetical protein